jgi:hypothetical protein
MAISKFERNFRKVIKEADDLEQRAFEASLDDGTDPTDFEVNADQPSTPISPADKAVHDAMSKRNQEIVNELQGWITEIETFLAFLNSEDPSSIQSRLAGAEPDTVMDKMKQSQQTKISRVASDLASLHQNFLGFMAQTSNPRYRYV